MTDFLFDIIIYYLSTILGYTKSATFSSILLPLEWLAFRLEPAWNLAGLYDISTSVYVCRGDQYVSKVSWACRPWMPSVTQSMCAAVITITSVR